MPRHEYLRPVPQLQQLWRLLTPTMRSRLARIAKTSPESLRQYVDGRRAISPDAAIKIEKATLILGVDPISRMTLNDTCRRCSFAKAACKLGIDPVGKRAIALAQKRVNKPQGGKR